MNTKVKISTGTYNCKDYRCKSFSYEKSALKYARSHGFTLDEICNWRWSKNGTQFTISVDNN